MMDSVTQQGIQQVDGNRHSSDSVAEGCKQNWQRLKMLQSQLSGVSVMMTGDLRGNELSETDTLSLLKEQKKRLEAELVALEERGLQTLPKDADMQRLIIHQDHEEHLHQLKETLAFVRAKRTELDECISKDKDTRKQLEELNAALKEKVAKLESSQSEEESTSTEHILSDLRLKKEKISKLDKSYKRVLISLLNKHFPLPSEQDQSKDSKNALNNTQSFDINDLVPLRAIIGKLVEQTLNSPSDPYIDIDETMWPQHIEFLLRSQIVRKNPKKPMKMRLIPFHL